jgi:hypothetical protein
MRVMQVFTIVSGALGRLASSKKGCSSPGGTWITSTGNATEAEDAADEAAYMLREKKRKCDRERIRREGRDECDMRGRLNSWMDKRPICHIQKQMGHDVNVHRELEMCDDTKHMSVVS